MPAKGEAAYERQGPGNANTKSKKCESGDDRKRYGRPIQSREFR